jgi:RHS repeat-associated protein
MSKSALRSFGLAITFAVGVAVAGPDAFAQSMFSHQIPIKLPKAPNGTQPEIALAYMPGTGNGIVGVGWQVTGLPSITRVNYGNGIRYAGADTYAHSQLGILVKQGDGTYRTKKESFTKFVPSSATCGDAGPCSWTMYAPSGTTQVFGVDAAHRLTGYSGNPGAVRTWGLSSTTDPFGNSYDVAYLTTQLTTDGKLYPEAVTYNRTSDGTATTRTVGFTYEDRTDSYASWDQKVPEKYTKRLKWIGVTSGSTFLRKYRLDYEYGTATGYSHLKAVQEYGSDGTSTLPAQTFNWQQGQFGYTQTMDVSEFTRESTSAYLTGDVDGDGKADMVRVVSSAGATRLLVYGWTGSGYVERSNNPFYTTDAKGTFLTGDVDGDGKTDVIQVANNQGCAWVLFYKSNGVSFDLVSTQTFSVPPEGKFSIGDVDGDGKADIIQFRSESVWGGSRPRLIAYRSNGYGYNAPWSNTFYDVPYTGWFLTGDVNGDGKTDVISVGSNGAYARVFLWFSDGNGYGSSTWSNTMYSAPAGGTYLACDVNGDGMTDVLEVTSNGAYARLLTMVSNGTGYSDAQWSNTFYSAPTAETRNWVVADVNGDGRSDVLQVRGNGGRTQIIGYQSDGIGFGLTWSNTSGADSSGSATFASDLDGDGKADLTTILPYGTTQGISVYTAMGSQPDLMTGIDNGLGGTVSVSYAPMPRVPGAIDPRSTASGIPNTSPRPLVTRIETRDGRGGALWTSYGYHDARYLPGKIPEQRLLGFDWIEVVDEQTAQSTRTYFDQRPKYEGYPASVEARARIRTAPRVLSRTVNTYDVVETVGATASDVTELVREVQRQVTTYDLDTGTAMLVQTTATGYDAWGNPTLVTQSARNLVTMIDDPVVVVSTVYDNDPVSWSLRRLKEVQTRSGGTILGWMKNAWASRGTLECPTDHPRGVCLTSKSEWLDTKGPPSSAGAWVTTTMKYDRYGNLTSVTEPPLPDGLTRTTTTTYQARFHAYPETVTNALNHVVTRTYDDDGLVRSVRDVNNNTTWTTYDVFGRVEVVTRPDGGTTTHYYVSYGNPSAQYNEVVTKVDATRWTWVAEYFDGSGFKYFVTRDGDCPSSNPSARYVTITTEKDFAGRPARVSQPFCQGGPTAVTETLFDDAGRPSVTSLPDGQTIEFAYKPTYESRFDQNGHETRRYFNGRNRVTSVRDAAGQTTSYGYDPLGRVTSITLPGSATTNVVYDSLNRKTRVTDPQLGVTTNTWDALGNLTSVVTGGKLVEYGYDILNRPTWKRAQGKGTVTFTYDESAYANGKGALTTVNDPNGPVGTQQTTHYAHDGVGHVSAVSKTIAGSNFTEGFEYDLAGHVKRIRYPNGSNVDYTYTAAGNLQMVTLDATFIASWTTFDAQGRPGDALYGNTVATHYTYDQMGHLTSVVAKKDAYELQKLNYYWYSGTNSGGVNLGWIEDARANKVIGNVNTDETQHYAYDELNRLRTASGVWGVPKAYDYDAIGNPYNFGGITQRTLSFTGQQVTSGTNLSNVSYDAAGNMKHKVLDGVTWDYTWDSEGFLVSAARAGATTTMAYDASGQRVSKLFAPVGRVAIVTVYVDRLYEKRMFSDGRTPLHTLHIYANGQLIASRTVASNVVTASSTPTTWGEELALGSMYDPRTLEGAALRVLHTVRGLAFHPLTRRWVAPTLLALVALTLLGVFAHAIIRQLFSRRRYSPMVRATAVLLVLAFGVSACGGGSGGLGSTEDPMLSGNTVYGVPAGMVFYHRNHVNSSTVITDRYATPGSETRIVYTPFGEIDQNASTGPDAATAKFTGKEYDEETGLYYYGARYYDPALGRFVSPDSIVPSITDAQSWNRYTYVRDNPVVLVDPTGHSAVSTFFDNVAKYTGQAAAGMANAASHAGRWLDNALDKTGAFFQRAGTYAWEITKATVSNPMFLATFVIAVIATIATGNPGWLYAWAASTSAAIAAESMALAAGCRNPTTLAIIGMTAAVIAGSPWSPAPLWVDATRAAGSYGLSVALGKLEGSREGQLAPLNALAIFLIVNMLSRALGAKPAAVDPGDENPLPTGDSIEGAYEQAADTGKTLKQTMCELDARDRAMAEAAKQINPQEKLRDYKPALPVKPGIGVVTRILYFLGIIRPLAAVQDRRQQLYEECMALPDNNI